MPQEFNRLRLSILAASVAALPCAALAQDEPAGEPIVVTGQGLRDTPATPAYGAVDLDRELIASSASGRIEDVLSSVAGFQQFRRSDSRSSNPSAQGVTLRSLGGNATSRALVLLDGVPMADPFFGYIPLSSIDPQRIRAIRVTRGGGAGAFGAGAVAGTIELTSAGADTLPLLTGSALINDREETEMSGIAAPPLGSGFMVASARWDRGKGFYTTPLADRVPASARAGFDSWSTSLRVVAPISDTIEIQGSGMLFEDQRTLRFEGADSSSKGGDLSVRLVGRGEWQFDVLGYVQDRNFTNIVISSTTFRQALNQRDTPSTGIGGKFELRPPVGPDHVLKLGADLRISKGNLTEEPFSGSRRAGGRNTDLGLFLEDDWTIGPLVLTAGLRGDSWKIANGFFQVYNGGGVLTTDSRFANRSDWDFSWRGGAVFDAGNGLSLRAAGYTGLRLPTLNELYRPFVVFPVTTNANAELRNERLEGFEAGIDYAASDNVTLTLTAFDNRVKNAIANVTLDPVTRQRQNVDAVHVQGLEFGASLRFGTVSLVGSLALGDAEMKSSGVSAALDGNRPPQVPEVAASATLAWEPRENWRLAATLRHVGRQFEDDLETDVLPAATTLDAYAEVPVTPGIGLILRGENLTDERVITRNQGGSMDLGTPLTVWAGIRLRAPR